MTNYDKTWVVLGRRTKRQHSDSSTSLDTRRDRCTPKWSTLSD